MKRISACLLIITLTMTSFVCAFGADTFSDVPAAYEWAKPAISELADADMLTGYPDGTFKPGNSVTNQEAITLFARALGFNNASNTLVVDLAYNTYKDEVLKYSTYAKKEVAYLLYKGVLQLTDLQTYIGSNAYSTPIKRYEAAILITKVLGGQAAVDSMISIVPYYADHADIPAHAMGYIEYVRVHGIMKGVEGNKFAPASDITRAQIAVILQRILTSMTSEYITGTVLSYDVATGSLQIKTADQNTSQFTVGSDVVFKLDGEKIATTAITPGAKIVLTFSYNKLVSIDAETVFANKKAEGIFLSATTDNSGTTISIMPVGGTENQAKSYLASSDIVITHNGKTATISSFERGDYVKFETKGNKLLTLFGEEKGSTMSGVLEGIVFEPQYKLNVRDANNVLHELSTLSNVTVKRNGAASSLRDLAVGDKLTIELEYNIVRAITATSSSRTIAGTITEITISQTPSIKIKQSSGETLALAISRDVQIISDGVESPNLYSLRLNQTITVTLESNTVVKLEVKTPVTKSSLTGTVVSVNTSYGFIDLEVTDATTMVTATQKIFVKKTATIVDAKTGNSKALKDIVAGNKITVTGTTTLGVFEATVIIIEA